MRSTIVLAAAAMAGFVAAQTSTSCTTPTVTLSGGAQSTITNVYTSTYCPACEEVTTTYETVYTQVCPTGLSAATYTITETCNGASPSRTTGVPAGFTTVVEACDVCAESSYTVTQPCTACAEATMTSTYPAVYSTFCSSGLCAATYTATASCAALPCPTNSVAAGFTTTVAACSTCGSAPITATLTVPVVAGIATTVAAAGSNSSVAGGTTPMTPYTGAASSNNVGAYFGAAAFAVLALAF